MWIVRGILQGEDTQQSHEGQFDGFGGGVQSTVGVVTAAGAWTTFPARAEQGWANHDHEPNPAKLAFIF